MQLETVSSLLLLYPLLLLVVDQLYKAIVARL